MAIIKIYTDDGAHVSSFKITGHMNGMFGWLDRALQDACLIQESIDPERPTSEKVMRFMAEKRAERARRS